MNSSILEKINKELNNGIDTEPKVLYLLAEIRKFLDRSSESEKESYPNLYLYCNWVLHIQMDRTPAKQILNRFESRLSNADNLTEMSNIIKQEEKNFYYFVDLKRELHNFLTNYTLSTELTDNGRKWFNFKKLLVAILIDCSLVNSDSRVYAFYYERGVDEQIRFRVKITGLGSFKITLKEK